jgi:hypothetical protein
MEKTPAHAPAIDLLDAFTGRPANIGEFALVARHLIDQKISGIPGAFVRDEVG